MRVIARKTLVDYWQKVHEPMSELEAWYSEAKSAEWKRSADIKEMYGNDSILKDVLVVWINYAFKTIYIRFVGTHKEYDAIDAGTI